MDIVKIEGKVPREFFNWFERKFSEESDLGIVNMLEKVDIEVVE